MILNSFLITLELIYKIENQIVVQQEVSEEYSFSHLKKTYLILLKFLISCYNKWSHFGSALIINDLNTKSNIF